ncbi:15166_t:CDS:10 [Cetraspora pellucida]|uniref:15166_t:CDS:1 n=1 Tax=Cetraspora pellucida TaxID=1433469 RepID=A0A9N8WLE8_9GLOM|nr:15166_t:CDS:10 [Cetraspora pellucida]
MPNLNSTRQIYAFVAMDKKILNLSFKNEIDNLISYLDTVEIKQIADLVKSYLKDEVKFFDEHKGCFAMIRALFKGSIDAPDKQDTEKQELRVRRRVTIMLEIVKWLSEKGNDTSSQFDKIMSDLVELCINEVVVGSNISLIIVKAFVEATTCIIHTMQRVKPIHGKLFAFLPMFLSTFDIISDEIELPSGKSSAGTSMSGPDYKDYVLNKICSYKWHASNVLSLIGEFRDIVMTNDQLQFIVEKIMRQFDSMDMNGIPPLIYQMLLLSRKGHKRLILRGISEHFNSLDEEVTDDQESNSDERVVSSNSLSFAQLSHMEGTVIIHICFAITQDQELGNEFMKYVKMSKTALFIPFNISCLLSIARILRFKDQTLDFLKSSIMSAFKDQEKLEKAKWISHVDSSKIIASAPISEIFCRIIRKTSFGWDQVTQSLVQLGILILDSAVPSNPFGKSVDTVKVLNGPATTSNEMAGDLGTTILFEMFKIHEMVRAEILEQILTRVISKAPSAGYFLNLLQLIVKETPHSLHNHLSKIKGTLDYLTFLPAGIADIFLKTIQPIILVNKSFRDGLMLVLRKGMSTKDVEGRKNALAGYLQLLRITTIKGPDSQAISQVPTSSSKSLSKQDQNSLFFEILRILRRCFSQQPQIRLSLYQGLIDLMDAEQNLKPIVFDILFPHASYFRIFQQYFELETSIHATILLDSCLNSVDGSTFIIEPLPYLFSCISKSITFSDPNDEIGKDDTAYDKGQLQKCKDFIQLLIERLLKADMTEFSIDPASDFKMASSEGMRNNLSANLLLGCYEAAIEHVFFSEEHSLDSSQKILTLFKKYMILFEVLREKSVNVRGRKTLTTMPESTILSFKCIAELIKFIFSDDLSHATALLRTDTEFMKYIIAVAYNTISQHSSFDPGDHAKFEHCTYLASVFMSKFIKDDKCPNVIQNDDSKKDKGKSSLSIALESFMLLTQAVSTSWPDKLKDFLELSYHSEESEELNERRPDNLDGWLNLYIQEFERLMVSSLSERTPQINEASWSCKTISLLSTYYVNKSKDTDSESQGHIEQLIEWLNTLCKERVIEDTGLAKIIVNLLLKLERDMADFDTVVEMAHDMFVVLGPITGRPESDETQSHKYMIVNARTSATVCGILIEFLNAIYDEMEWYLTKLRALCGASGTDSDEAPEFEEVEQEICLRLIKLMNSMLHLEKTCLQSTTSENLLKCLQRAYKVLVALTRYKIAEAGEIQDQFTAVIKLAGGDLTNNLYNFLTAFGQVKNSAYRLTSKKGKTKSKPLTQKARITKESKIIPVLIFILEQFERYTMQLSKKSKTDLMHYITTTTSRDFKIKIEELDGDTDNQPKRVSRTAASNEQEDDEVEEGGSEDHRRKRRCSDSSMEID